MHVPPCCLHSYLHLAVQVDLQVLLQNKITEASELLSETNDQVVVAFPPLGGSGKVEGQVLSGRRGLQASQGRSVKTTESSPVSKKKREQGQFLLALLKESKFGEKGRLRMFGRPPWLVFTIQGTPFPLSVLYTESFWVARILDEWLELGSWKYIGVFQQCSRCCLRGSQAYLHGPITLTSWRQDWLDSLLQEGLREAELLAE